MEELEFLYISGGGIQWFNHFGEVFGDYVCMHSLQISASSLTRIYPKEMNVLSQNLCTRIFKSSSYKIAEKLETT